MSKHTLPQVYQDPQQKKTDLVVNVSKEDLALGNFIQDAIEKKYKGVQMMDLAGQAGIKLSYRSMMLKIEAYKKDGLKGIVRKARDGKGETKSFSNPVLQFLQDKFVNCQCAIRSYEETHKWLRQFCIEFSPDRSSDVQGEAHKIQNGQLYSIANGGTFVMQLATEFIAGEYRTPEGECLTIGTYRSAARYLSTIKSEHADALHFKRYGKDSYRSKRQHSIYRDYSNLQPNDLWCSDNKKVDIIIIDWDWKSVFRPWFSGFIQVPTRRYLYEISRSADSDSICNGFVFACRKWGLPKKVNHDHGKDFKSNRVEQMFKALRVEQILSIPRNARAKIIESFHNILDNKLKALPGYTGNKYQEMPIETKEMLKVFTKAEKVFKNIEKSVFDDSFKVTLNSNLEGKLKSSKKRFLHISEFMRVVDEALAEYEETEHGGLKDDKLGKKVFDRLCLDDTICKYSEKLNTPKGRYEYSCELGFTPTYLHPAILSVHAMNSRLASVSTKGIQYQNNHYFSPKLKKVLFKKVVIKFVESDDRIIYVFTSDEIQKLGTDKLFKKLTDSDGLNQLEFICEAEKVPTYMAGDDSYKDQIKKQRTEEKQIRESLGMTRIKGPNIIQINDTASEILKLESEKRKIKPYKDSWDD